MKPTSELVLDIYDLDAYQCQLAFGDGIPVVLCYLRVSKKQNEEHYSLDTQAREIRRECRRRFGDNCHLLWLTENGYSGKLGFWHEGLTSGEWRPGLQFAAELIAEGVINYVATYDCSRLARSLYVWFQMEQLHMAPHSVVYFSAAEGLDTSTEAGKEDVAMYMAMASGEWEHIVRTKRAGMKRRLEENYFIGARPYGWQWLHRWKSQGQGRSDIIPVPEEADIVRQMVHMCLSGRHPTQIRDRTQALGLLSPQGNKRWGVDTITSALRNPVHCGLVRRADGLHRGAHYESRIIEECEYYAVQKMIAGIDKRKMYEHREQDWLYEGLAVCGLCGGTMGVLKSPAGRGCYACLGHRVGRKHSTFSVLSDRVYGVVFKSVVDLAASQEFADTSSERLSKLLEEEFGDLEKQRSILTRRIDRGKRDYVAVARRNVRGEISSAEFAQFRKESRAELASLEEALDAVENKAKMRSAREKELIPALAVLRDFPRLWAVMEPSEQKDALSLLVSKLVLTPNETHITMHLELVLGEPVEVQLYSSVRSAGSGGLDSLTPNELLVASLLLKGRSVADVAREKGVGEETVHQCIRHLRERAGKDNLNEALKLIAPYIEVRQCDLEQKASWKRIFGLPINEQHLQVLELVRAGFNIREMARMLSTDERHVVYLRDQAYHRLGVHSRDNAVSEAIRRGLIRDVSNCGRPSDGDVEIIEKLAAWHSYASVASEHGMTLDELLDRLAGLCSHCGVARNYQLFGFARERGWIESEDPALNTLSDRTQTVSTEREEDGISGLPGGSHTKYVLAYCCGEQDDADIEKQAAELQNACSARIRSKRKIVWITDAGDALDTIRELVAKDEIFCVAVYSCAAIDSSAESWTTFLVDYLIPYNVQFFSVVERVNSRADLASYIDAMRQDRASRPEWQRNGHKPVRQQRPLSPRLAQVANLRAQGFTIVAIAERLRISPRYVGKLAQRVNNKLGGARIRDGVETRHLVATHL